MAADQLAVDRFIGGRFQRKKVFAGINHADKTRDIPYGTGKALPETAKAGNQCHPSHSIDQGCVPGAPSPFR